MECVIEQIEKYRSFDQKIFDSKEQCLEYEDTRLTVISNTITIQDLFNLAEEKRDTAARRSLMTVINVLLRK